MELGGVPQTWMNLPLVFMVFHGWCQEFLVSDSEQRNLAELMPHLDSKTKLKKLN